MAPEPERLAEARAALARLGVSRADLRRDARARVPTLPNIYAESPRRPARRPQHLRQLTGNAWRRCQRGSPPADTVVVRPVRAWTRCPRCRAAARTTAQAIARTTLVNTLASVP